MSESCLTHLAPADFVGDAKHKTNRPPAPSLGTRGPDQRGAAVAEAPGLRLHKDHVQAAALFKLQQLWEMLCEHVFLKHLLAGHMHYVAGWSMASKWTMVAEVTIFARLEADDAKLLGNPLRTQQDRCWHLAQAWARRPSPGPLIRGLKSALDSSHCMKHCTRGREEQGVGGGGGGDPWDGGGSGKGSDVQHKLQTGMHIRSLDQTRCSQTGVFSKVDAYKQVCKQATPAEVF